jgi:hypothetical protein
MSDQKYPIAPEDEGLSALDAGPEMCSLDIAVLNVTFGKIHFLNIWTRDWIRKACQAMNEKGIRPEFELFAPTSLEDFKNILVKEGIAKPPYSCTLVMGMKVSQGAMDYTPENLMVEPARGHHPRTDHWRQRPRRLRGQHLLPLRRTGEEQRPAGRAGGPHDPRVRLRSGVAGRGPRDGRGAAAEEISLIPTPARFRRGPPPVGGSE